MPQVKNLAFLSPDVGSCVKKEVGCCGFLDSWNGCWKWDDDTKRTMVARYLAPPLVTRDYINSHFRMSQVQLYTNTFFWKKVCKLNRIRLEYDGYPSSTAAQHWHKSFCTALIIRGTWRHVPIKSELTFPLHFRTNFHEISPTFLPRPPSGHMHIFLLANQAAAVSTCRCLYGQPCRCSFWEWYSRCTQVHKAAWS